MSVPKQKRAISDSQELGSGTRLLGQLHKHCNTCEPKRPRCARWQWAVCVDTRIGQRRSAGIGTGRSTHHPVRAGHPRAALVWRALLAAVVQCQRPLHRIRLVPEPERAADAPVDRFRRERVVNRAQQMMVVATGRTTVRIERGTCSTATIEQGARAAGHPINTSPKRTPEALLERKICIVVVVGSDGRCGRCCCGREFRLFRSRQQLGPLAGLEKAGQIRMPMGPLAAVVREGWQRMMVWLLLLLMMLGVGIGTGREGRWLAQVQRFVVGKGSCPECRY
uniref:Uncharacterized protein n=1 Tax=Anopheles coluzzii TaxID=1518534 RepID=A0A8W7P0M1_ANOCL